MSKLRLNLNVCYKVMISKYLAVSKTSFRVVSVYCNDRVHQRMPSIREVPGLACPSLEMVS